MTSPMPVRTERPLARSGSLIDFHCLCPCLGGGTETLFDHGGKVPISCYPTFARHARQAEAGALGDPTRATPRTPRPSIIGQIAIQCLCACWWKGSAAVWPRARKAHGMTSHISVHMEKPVPSSTDLIDIHCFCQCGSEKPPFGHARQVRIECFYATIVKCLLCGAGLWAPTGTLLGKLRSWENGRLR